MHIQKLISITICIVILVACGGGDISSNGNVDSSSNNGVGDEISEITANTEANETTSLNYFNASPVYFSKGELSWWYHGLNAVAYADFNGDGHDDALLAPQLAYHYELEIAYRNDIANHEYEEVPVGFYINDGNDNYYADNTLFEGPIPTMFHPRKAIVGDYNGDQKPDVFVIGHGIDRLPYPGEAPVVILSTPNGYIGKKMDQQAGFFHAGASGDVDADGDIDVLIVSSNIDNVESFFYLNDGDGGFTYSSNILPPETGYFTGEMYDVDSDGFLDILLAGHEHEGMESTIYWGSSTGSYSADLSTILPGVDNYGVVLDIDVIDFNQDGKSDIVLNRTGSGWATFYNGYYLQALMSDGSRGFIDRTEQTILGNEDAESNWIDWLRVRDVDDDGDKDILVDEAQFGLSWINNGAQYEVNSNTNNNEYQSSDLAGVWVGEVRDSANTLLWTRIEIASGGDRATLINQETSVNAQIHKPQPGGVRFQYAGEHVLHANLNKDKNVITFREYLNSWDYTTRVFLTGRLEKQ